MYNQSFYFPNYFMMRPTPKFIATRSSPLIGKIGNIYNGIKTFNWNNLLNNTSKTLGIINQTIPLVKQVGPIVGNMKSMIKLASIFKDETDIKVQQPNTNSTIENTLNDNNTESPTFFIK